MLYNKKAALWVILPPLEQLFFIHYCDSFHPTGTGCRYSFYCLKKHGQYLTMSNVRLLLNRHNDSPVIGIHGTDATRV